LDELTVGRIASATVSSAITESAQEGLSVLADLPRTIQAPGTENQILTCHRSPLAALTGLRFFAASYVIVFHTRLSTMFYNRDLKAAGNFISNGYLAVPLFFMLSGFILTYNYRRHVETLNHALRFWEARFARIWPAYIFSLICSSFPLSHIPSLPMALRVVFMVQSWDPFHPEYAGLWNFVCWTLSVEAFFYLVFPLMQFCLERVRPAQMAVLGLCVISIAFFFNTPYHNYTLRYSGPWFYIPAPLIHLPEFVTGVILGNLYLQGNGRLDWFRFPRRKWGVGSTISASPMAGEGARFPILTFLGLISSFFILSVPHDRWEALVLPTFGVLMFGLATESSALSRLLSTRILLLGGEISYAMYLLRTPIQQWVFAISAPQLRQLAQALYLPLGLIPLSLLSFYFIEGPSRKRIRRFFAMLQKG